MCELERNWPVDEWGAFNQSSIGVVCYYTAQVVFTHWSSLILHSDSVYTLE